MRKLLGLRVVVHSMNHNPLTRPLRNPLRFAPCVMLALSPSGTI
jgi:hypothetical protein